MAKSKKITTIDIGSDSIKLLTGVWSADKKVNLKKCIVQPLVTGSYQKYGTDIQYEVLEELLKKNKIHEKVNISFANPNIQNYCISMPDMPKNEFKEAIKWELIQKKKVDLKESIFDYIISPITYDKKSKNKNIFISLEKTEEVKKILDICTSRKVKVNTIESPNNALINSLLKFNIFPTNKTYIVLNLCASYSYLLIIHDHRFVFERRLNTGGNTLTKSVAEYCKMDIENADKLKKDYGISMSIMSDNIIEAHHILTSSLEKLVADIQYSLKYFSFQGTKSKITTYDKVFITGGLANLSGLKDFIQERLSLECSVVDFSDYVHFPKDYTISEKDNPYALFNTALGLGFWDEKELNDYSLSLLPEEIRVKDSPKTVGEKIKFGLGSTFVIITILFAIALYCFLDLRYLNHLISELRKEEQNYELIIKEKEKDIEEERKQFIALDNEKLKLKLKLAEEQNKVDAINSYSMESHPPAKIMKFISDLIPEKMYLHSLSLDESFLIIKGLSLTNDNISKFMKVLNAIENYKNCTFSYIKKNKDGLLEFELKLEKKNT